ncbi:MAG: DUF3043 domain-containing protein, partial [Candidatus Nanopelagicales bacterium]|nr:DUF3043 domain-containing protein [Candidatus Nanopelagicales bacterium]
PTPSRKEAEAARKQALKAPKDPRAARRAARGRDRAARAQQRAALMAGDERALPARDQGPVRRYVRDYVDSRFTIAEYFIFVALAVLVLGFIPNPVIQFAVSISWMVLIALVAFDELFLLVRLNSALRKRFPDKAERKGALWYAGLRTLQLRRFRLPPPRLRRGETPEEPRTHRD